MSEPLTVKQVARAWLRGVDPSYYGHSRTSIVRALLTDLEASEAVLDEVRALHKRLGISCAALASVREES